MEWVSSWSLRDASQPVELGPVSRMDDDEGRAGCLIEGYSDRLNGLSSSPENAQHVADTLEVAEQEGRFTCEIGRQRTS